MYLETPKRLIIWNGGSNTFLHKLGQTKENLTWENLRYLYFRTEIVIWHPLFILLYLPVSTLCNAAAPSLCMRRGHITPPPISEQQMRQGHAYAIMPPQSIGTDRLTSPSALSLADTNEILPCRATLQVIWFTRMGSCVIGAGAQCHIGKSKREVCR